MFTTIALLMQGLLAQATPPDVSLETLCQNQPDRIVRLFEALDLTRPGLEKAKEAAEVKDWPNACQALLDYYRTSPWAAKFRIVAKPASAEHNPEADAILNDNYTLYSVTDKVPRRADGGLEWAYNGPTGDKEWGWGLNRHPWVGTLLDAYADTGNPGYINTLDKLLSDWVLSNPYPGQKSSTPQWRGLEVFFRAAEAWPRAFFGLQEAAELTPATKILILSSIPDHAHYNRHFHSDHGNWVTMEMRGLASAAGYWPEFKDANAWFDYAVGRMTPELTNQVYPDGAQKELSSCYHRVALYNFEKFMRLAEEMGKAVPAEYSACIERMCDYSAKTMNPFGYGLLNHDSDLESTRVEVLEEATRHTRPDWTYIATNGAEGVKPDGPPSTVFPWAGQFVMRSGWDSDAQWGFFETGPLGIGHWHYDKLHLSVAAYGRDILVDGGRFTYQGGPWRTFFKSSASHNVVLVDGHGQKEYAKEAQEPMTDNYAIAPEYDFVRGVYDAGFDNVEGAATHTRAVFYMRGGYWLVVDRISTDQPRDITALWHFHPECTVISEGTSVVSTDDGKGNVRIVPSAGTEWKLDLIRGQEQPDIQGWWSCDYNIKEPNTCAAYTTRIEGPVDTAWLIIPGKGSISKGTVTLVEAGGDADLIRVELPGGTGRTVRVPFSGNAVLFE